jgi:predicted Fe-S protein YdhL (DUF1289 family)
LIAATTMEADKTHQRLVSPCAGVCILHTETKLCLGCYRTITEIAHWQDMSAEDQHQVMAKLKERKAADGR